MDHGETRAKLKEYAEDRITDKTVEDEMAVHIETCEICKRELLLWQEVAEKRKANERFASYIPKTFRERVSYRMNKINSEDSGNSTGFFKRNRKACGSGSDTSGRINIPYNGEEPRVEYYRVCVYDNRVRCNFYNAPKEEKIIDKVKQ